MNNICIWASWMVFSCLIVVLKCGHEFVGSSIAVNNQNKKYIYIHYLFYQESFTKYPNFISMKNKSFYLIHYYYFQYLLHIQNFQLNKKYLMK